MTVFTGQNKLPITAATGCAGAANSSSVRRHPQPFKESDMTISAKQFRIDHRGVHFFGALSAAARPTLVTASRLGGPREAPKNGIT
jgi:hypothetical protein